jgi:hypothetical protein
MKSQNQQPQTQSNYALWYKPRLTGGKVIKSWIKSALGITALEEIRAYRVKAAKDIEETQKLLETGIDGEGNWFINVCTDKKGEKECYPK